MTDAEAVLEVLSAPERQALQRLLVRVAMQPWTHGLPEDAILKGAFLPSQADEGRRTLQKFRELKILESVEGCIRLTQRGMNAAALVQRILRDQPRQILQPQHGLPLDFSQPLACELDWVKSVEKTIGRLDTRVKAKLAAKIEDVCTAPGSKGKEWKHGLAHCREIHVDNNFTMTYLVRGNNVVLLAIAHHDDIEVANRKASVEAKNEGLA